MSKKILLKKRENITSLKHQGYKINYLEELNDYREIAGLPNKKIYNKDTIDEEIRKYITNAGL